MKIINKEDSTIDLDYMASKLIDTLSLLNNVDPQIIQELREVKIKNNFNRLSALNKNATIRIENGEVYERLYRHFRKNVNENVVKKNEDKAFEVKTKHRLKDSNLYFEQNKVLLTMLTSNICTQNQIDRIKNLIEDSNTFTYSIKKVIRDTSKFNRIKELCRLQDERFLVDEKITKRLY